MVTRKKATDSFNTGTPPTSGHEKPIPRNGTESFKVGDRVQIVPGWLDPGDGRFERFVIAEHRRTAPASAFRRSCQTSSSNPASHESSIQHHAERREVFSRIRYTPQSLPILAHVPATRDAHGITLAVNELDRWLETRLTPETASGESESLLIPPDGSKALRHGEKNSGIRIICRGAGKRREFPVLLVTGGSGWSPLSLPWILRSCQFAPLRKVPKRSFLLEPLRVWRSSPALQ